MKTTPKELKLAKIIRQVARDAFSLAEPGEFPWKKWSELRPGNKAACIATAKYILANYTPKK